jgi:hypothetical protein
MSTAISSTIETRAPKVEFTKRFVQPPSSLYLTTDDQFRLEFNSSFVPSIMEFGARILEPDGEVIYYRQRLETTTARVAAVDVFDGLEGFLLGFQCVLISGAAGTEWNYGSVGLSRGAADVTRMFQVLAAGYLSLTTPLWWPGGLYRWTTEGQGFMRQIDGDNPAAGSNILEPVAENARWRLVGLEVSFVTDANAANRRFILQARRGGTVLFATAAAVVQPASTTFRYSVGHWGADSGNLDGRVAVNWPDHAILSSDDELFTAVANLQAGDDFGAPSLYVEEWFERS